MNRDENSIDDGEPVEDFSGPRRDAAVRYGLAVVAAMVQAANPPPMKPGDAPKRPRSKAKHKKRKAERKARKKNRGKR